MDVDVSQATGILRRRFPDLDIQRLSHLSRSDFDTFQTVGGLIFRFPRDAGAAAKLEREAAILPRLQPLLPLAISSPQFWSAADDAYPWSVAGYPKLVGVNGEERRPVEQDWPAVAATLAETFAALHTFPLKDARRAGIESRSSPSLAKMLERVTSFAATIRAAEPALCTPLVETYLDATVDIPAGAPLPRALCHADLKGEHFILAGDARSLTGIIDWSDIRITDPIIDFAYTFMWLGEGFVRLVLDNYPCEDREGTLRRAAFIARCHTLTGLGRQLSGESYGPLPLLKTQLTWAFAEGG